MNTVYLDAGQVRARFGGRSDMWLWRRLNNDPSFPRPIFIGNRRYWRVEELETWENAQAAASPRPRPGEAGTEAGHEG